MSLPRQKLQEHDELATSEVLIKLLTAPFLSYSSKMHVDNHQLSNRTRTKG